MRAGDEARVVAAGVLARVDLVGQAAVDDLLQRRAQLREDQLVAGDRAEDRDLLGGDVRAHPGRLGRDPAAAEDGVVEDADRVGDGADDERRLLGAGVEAGAARRRRGAWIEAWSPTIRSIGLRRDWGERLPVEISRALPVLEPEGLAPLLVDDGVDRRPRPAARRHRCAPRARPRACRAAGSRPCRSAASSRSSGAMASSPPATRSQTTCLSALACGVKRRYVAGSTAATVSAWFSITAWPMENRAVVCTPFSFSICATMSSSSGRSGLKTSMSADASGSVAPAGRVDGVLRVGDRHPVGLARRWAAVGRGRRRGGGLGIVTPAAARRPHRPARSRPRAGAAVETLPPGQGRWVRQPAQGVTRCDLGDLTGAEWSQRRSDPKLPLGTIGTPVTRGGA